jgi:hypothetical protein
MRIRSFFSVLAVVSVFSCKEPGLFTSYRDIGSFSSRVQGQNQALVHILDKYSSLPTNKEYKVKYANNNALPNEARQNALWYDKRKEVLSLEVDIPDGPSCSWKNVTKAVLEEAVKSSDGMRSLEYFAVPNQPTNTCLR